MVSCLGRANPIPKRSGMPRTRSTPSACSSKTSSIVSGDSRRTPPASPPSDMTRIICMTDLALPCPLVAPMSASRQAAVLAAAPSATGPVNVRATGPDRRHAGDQLGLRPDCVPAGTRSGGLGGGSWLAGRRRGVAAGVHEQDDARRQDPDEEEQE